ncbi:MAG TPA: 3'(2'),5'-bisphosphate nucleotidase CysQ [Methylomirabilota bacterium]|nr:3'(2'),5'-bisphosphate nucleotidase CysQ [Methylomirabilota bacterium]
MSIRSAVIEAARRAGARIQEVRADTAVDTKADESPVTRADRESDDILKAALMPLAQAAWLSEETADSEGRLTARRVWVVDPLDGTKDFIEGIPEYAVAVALVQDEIPVLAVVHNPATGDTFWAERGGGAFRNGRRIHVAEGGTVLASRSETKYGEFAQFPSWDVRPVGSIEYKLALVAAGEAAVTWSRGPKHEWDVCAGALIVQEAGGIATELAGTPLRFNQPRPKVRGILAGAPSTYARALTELAAVGASGRMAELDR